MSKRIHIYGFAILVVLGIIVLSDFALRDFLHRPSLFMEIHDWDDGDIKVYFDTGHGYNEKESERCDVRDYRSQRIKVAFPENTLNLRVDIEGSDHSFMSEKLKVGYFHWPFSFRLRSENFLPNPEVSIEFDEQNGYHFKLRKGARDPFFQIPFDDDLREELAKSKGSLLILMRTIQLLSLLSILLLFIPGYANTASDH